MSRVKQAKTAATHSEISRNFLHIEARLNAALRSPVRSEIQRKRKSFNDQAHRFRDRIHRLERKIEELRQEIRDADEWAKFYEDKALEAYLSLRDGQAYARQLGRELEQLRKDNGHVKATS
jgi:hypothetical protein